MKKNKINVVIIALLMISSSTLFAQGDNLINNKKHRIGFIMGYGGQAGLKVQYDYQVKFFQVQYYYAFLHRQTWGLDLLFQPQYNTTKYRYIDNGPDEINGFEFGINTGILIRKNIFRDFLSSYGFISTGPHYVSGAPQRQSKGFLFSHNIFIGLNIRLLKDIYLDIREGFRHMSNASLSEPNRGINDFVFSGGLFIIL